MKTIEGYDVKIFTDNVEESAVGQIKQLLSIDVFSNCKIRIIYLEFFAQNQGLLSAGA